MKTLIANIGLVKRLKSSVSPKGKQRALAVLLAVATLLTALVVIPITLPATEAGADTTSNASYLSQNDPSPGAFYTGDRMTCSVFYASTWSDKAWSASTDTTLFSGERYTQTSGTNTIGYHSTEKAFVFRAQEGTNVPYVYLRPYQGTNNSTLCAGMNQPAGGLGKLKYVTITYAVYNKGGTNNSDGDVNFRIYGLSADGTSVSGLNNCMEQPIVTNEADDDTERTYRTIIFDLSGCDWWSGSQVGLRLDYFVSKVNENYTEKMVMFIDSIGFFKTMDEAKMHERERDWARNGKKQGYNDEKNDRNIFRASDGNWDGYFSTIAESRKITSREYDPTQNAYKIVPSEGNDPGLFFILNGSNKYGNNNQYKRIITTNFCKYIAIRMKVKSTQTEQTECNIGNVELFMFYDQNLNSGDLGSYKLSGQSSLSEYSTGFVPNDEYFTVYFDISDLSLNSYVRGFRFDPMTNADEAYTIYVESIGFFDEEDAAKNHGTESLKLDAEDMDTYIDRGSKSWHRLTTSIEDVDGQTTLKLKTDKTKECTGVCKLESEVEDCDTYCKLFAAQASSLASGHVIDPYVTLTIPNGGIRVSSHPYMVITYYVSKDNDGENTLSYSNCTPNISTAYSQLNQTNYYETYNAHPFSFFPSGYAKNGTSINAAEINRTQLWVSESQLGTFITAYIELAIQDSNENEADLITKIRIDPYNRHIVKNNKSMNIASIGFYNSLEGIDEFENDQYPYSFELTLDENIDSNSSQTNTYKASNFEMIMTQTLSSDALDTSTGEVKYTFQINNENIRFYRDNYKFIGWGIKDAEGNITEMLTLNDETHAYEVTLTIDTNSDEPYATTSSNTKLYKATLTVYAVWQLQTGALTITQDKDTTPILLDGDRMVYMIQGETKDNAVIPFTDLYVSAQSDPNGNIVVHLPVGDYTIQCIDGWNWRYTATAATAEISAAETYSLSDGKLSITNPDNAKTGNVDFTEESNSSWLNGYGYAAKDIPATDS